MTEADVGAIADAIRSLDRELTRRAGADSDVREPGRVRFRGGPHVATVDEQPPAHELAQPREVQHAQLRATR